MATGTERSLSDIIASVPPDQRWKLDKEIDFEHRNERTGLVVPKHLGRIADSMTEWEGAVAESLGLTEPDKYDIKEKFPTKPDQQRRMALGKWKNRLGNKATYRALIQVFCDADRTHYADLVCKLFGVYKPAPPPPSPPIMKTTDNTPLPAPNGNAEPDTRTEVKPEDTASRGESPPEPQQNEGLRWCVNRSKDKPGQSKSLPGIKMARGTLQQKCLWDCDVLYVKFLNDIPENWFFRRGGMNLENIITLAQKWNPEGEEFKHIPKIKEMKHNGTPHIRVRFTDKESSYSLVGAEENSVSPRAPTMWLNLSQGTDEYKRHLVVHEFGHALGLDHEHQRRDLWALIKPCVNLQVMKSDRDIEGAYDSYIEDANQDNPKTTAYDPDSVMHYWFKKSWLKEDYNTEEKVDSATDISQEQKKALKGILKQSKLSFVMQPSNLDLQLLEECYKEKKADPPTNGNATPAEQPIRREGPPAPNPNNWPWKIYMLGAVLVAVSAVLGASFLLRRRT